MSTRNSDYRVIGRQHAQDKRSRDAEKLITAAEDAYEAASAAWVADPSPTADYSQVRAAHDALYELDPTNGRLT